ncbi:MAG: hypothetical protein ABIJ21_01285 [Nanoarchaeota archaeon]
MGFVKVLGVFDIVAGVLILLGTFFHFLPQKAAIVFAIYLIIKGLLFLQNFTSKLDVIIGAYIFLLLVYPITLLSVVFSAHLIIKGSLSVI